LLGAAEKDLGGCIIASIDRDQLRRALKIEARHEILLVIALGKPAEKVVIEEVGPDGDIKYWRDSQGVHHVPKRSLDTIIIG
jgi:nitroreductase